MSKDTKKTPPALDQTDLSEKALNLKQEGASDADAEYLQHQTDTAGEGRISGDSDHNPPMGALDAEGHRPVLERSRKVR
ncbi:hypothetical protein [Blastomonas sp.]|uniref:hypothetical protein n=1 Tax=Blastomonas sp. TaxID=1909299 RepID=UPI00261DA6CE|nr:hypothetical protein [Blastomonas sp.]MDM7956883.1 hypothetical protein [Blastomonas sp.]